MADVTGGGSGERTGDGGGALEPSGAQRRSVFPGFRDTAGEQGHPVADLAALRKRLGLSQTVVAARMGTSQSAVARLEAGDADARLSTIQRYADALGARLAWDVDWPGSFTRRRDAGAEQQVGDGGPLGPADRAGATQEDSGRHFGPREEGT